MENPNNLLVAIHHYQYGFSAENKQKKQPRNSITNPQSRTTKTWPEHFCSWHHSVTCSWSNNFSQKFKIANKLRCVKISNNFGKKLQHYVKKLTQLAFNWRSEFKSVLKCLHRLLSTEIWDSDSLKRHLQMLRGRIKWKTYC